jgi:hypothetical protein
MARAGSADLPDGESEIFFAGGLDKVLVICPTGSFRRTGDRFCHSGIAGWHCANGRVRLASSKQIGGRLI